MAEEVVIKVRVDTKDADKKVKGVEKSIDKLGVSAKKTSNKTKGFSNSINAGFSAMPAFIQGAISSLRAFKLALISTGVGAIVVTLGALTTLFVKANKKGAEFGKALSGLKAVTGSTNKELEVLSLQAKELGSSTAFTANKVVKLQTELAKLGFTVKDIETATPAILDLAASLEVDLASAASFAGSVVKSFGLETDQTQRVVDVMALSTTKSALSYDSLAESMKLVAPTSTALGVSVEKTTALLGVLADRGLKGSIAGTGLSKTFVELNKKGLTLEEAFEKVNKSGNKLNTAIKLVGVIGAKSLLNLAASGEKIAELEGTFDKAAGAAKRIAETRLDNLAGDTTKLSSAWEGFLLGIEDGEGVLNKISRGAIQLLTKSIEFIGTTIESFGFLWKDTWNNTKLTTSGVIETIAGSFDYLVSQIKIFSNKTILLISEIPIIGKAIDVSAVKSNLMAAEKELIDSQKRISKGQSELDKSNENQATQSARLKVHLEKKKNREIQVANEKSNSEAKKLAEKVQAEKTEEELKRIEKEKALEEKRLEDIDKIREKFKRKNEDLEDEDNLAKIERQYDRDLIELERLEATEQQKYELKKYYAGLIRDEEQKQYEEVVDFEDDVETNAEDEKLRKAGETANKEIQLAKDVASAKESIAARSTNLLIKLGGKAAKLGKAIAVARTVQSSIEGTQQAFKTASASPLNAVIPGYNFIQAGLAAGFGALKVKEIISSPETGGSASGSSSSSGGTAAPSFNLVQGTEGNQVANSISQDSKPVEAYVVGNSVTTQQELDRQRIANSSI